MRLTLASALAAIFMSGCSIGFHETHYFKSAEAPKSSAIANYYRLTVRGDTLLSSARYVSGYFDEDTINTYFNEFTQPVGGAIYPPGSTGSGRPAGAADTAARGQTVQPVAAGLQDKKLIMILSSNSDDVANQIGALAASKQFTASLAGLVARDQYTLAEDAERRLQLDRTRAKMIADLGTQLIAPIDPAAPSADVERRLLAFANRLAADLGYEGSFPSLENAAQWLNFNRGRLLRGDQ